MQQLTNAEEQQMEHLWKLEKAFMNLLEVFPEPKPKNYQLPLCLKE
jgi:hypothetical protein